MALYTRDTLLADALISNPQLIPVVHRLGVKLGVGRNSIGSICSSLHIDADFFLSIVNTFLNEDYFPALPSRFDPDMTVGYLRETGNYYRLVQIPNIERHFVPLIKTSGLDNNLSLLIEFFNQIKLQIIDEVVYDKSVLFPLIEKDGTASAQDLHANEHFEIEARLHDLLYFMVASLKGNYEPNLCNAVIQAISALDKDYSQNNRIRTRMLPKPSTL